MRRALFILLLTLSGLGVAPHLAAAPAVKPHRRATVIAPAPQPEPAVVGSAAPVRIQPRSAFRPSPAPSRIAPQCRAQCAETRYACLLGGDDSECDPQWIRCVVQCGGSGYTRLPSASPSSARRTSSSETAR